MVSEFHICKWWTIAWRCLENIPSGKGHSAAHSIEEQSFIEHSLTASRSWVLGIQWLGMVARFQLGGRDSSQKEVNYWIHMEGLNFWAHQFLCWNFLSIRILSEASLPLLGDTFSSCHALIVVIAIPRSLGRGTSPVRNVKEGWREKMLMN